MLIQKGDVTLAKQIYQFLHEFTSQNKQIDIPNMNHIQFESLYLELYQASLFYHYLQLQLQHHEQALNGTLKIIESMEIKVFKNIASDEPEFFIELETLLFSYLIAADILFDLKSQDQSKLTHIYEKLG